MSGDARTGEDRRKGGGKGRRRKDGTIEDLTTHPAKYVSVSEAIDYMNRECGGISRQMFYKYIRSGTIPTERGVTREIRIKTDALRLFLRTRRLA